MNQVTSFDQTSWNLSSRVAFRFFFVYFALYIFPFPISVLQIRFDFSLIWDAPVLWFGKTFFDYDITIRPNGSGDTTWNYIQVLIIAIIALAGTIVWSIVDRKRSNYNKLYFWLTIFLRYYLASVMIGYGFAKVIKTQFPSPFLARLTQTYGESSPMGLLWTFMGYSTGYNFFTGMAEILGGLLLFFRRTQLLGALVCIGVMSNVVMLNFAFDVPVKLYSSNLLLIAIFITAPDISRLTDFFIFNKAVPAMAQQPLFEDKRWRYGVWAVQTLFIGYVLVMHSFMRLEMLEKWNVFAPKPAFYGTYDVKIHALNGDTLPPVVDHKVRWKRMTIDFKDWATVDYMDEMKVYWRFSADTVRRSVSIYSMDSASHYKFNYAVDEAGDYLLTGGDSTNNIFFKLKRKLPEDFLLMDRGFNWVNEHPYNR